MSDVNQGNINVIVNKNVADSEIFNQSVIMRNVASEHDRAAWLINFSFDCNQVQYDWSFIQFFSLFLFIPSHTLHPKNNNIRCIHESSRSVSWNGDSLTNGSI